MQYLNVLCRVVRSGRAIFSHVKIALGKISRTLHSKFSPPSVILGAGSRPESYSGRENAASGGAQKFRHRALRKIYSRLFGLPVTERKIFRDFRNVLWRCGE